MAYGAREEMSGRFKLPMIRYTHINDYFPIFIYTLGVRELGEDGYAVFFFVKSFCFQMRPPKS
jgi:hypothetical protein